MEARLNFFLEEEKVCNVRLQDYLKALSVFEETRKYQKSQLVVVGKSFRYFNASN